MSNNHSSPSLYGEDTKFVPVQYQDTDGQWKVKLGTRRDNIRNNQRQEAFLKNLAQHGRIMDSCRVAGVSVSSVRRLRDTDPDFDEACIEAVQTYTDRLIAHHQNLVFEGTTKTTYDRQGNVVNQEQVFPVRLIELELKKQDEGYRDKREMNMKVSGGVLVAPADVGSIDDWEAKFANDKTIEGEAQEVNGTTIEGEAHEVSQDEG